MQPARSQRLRASAVARQGMRDSRQRFGGPHDDMRTSLVLAACRHVSCVCHATTRLLPLSAAQICTGTSGWRRLPCATWGARASRMGSSLPCKGWEGSNTGWAGPSSASRQLRPGRHYPPVPATVGAPASSQECVLVAASVTEERASFADSRQAIRNNPLHPAARYSSMAASLKGEELV